MSVTKIIHTGDIHIRNLRRIDEYQEILKQFIEECKKIVKDNGKEETRIVIAGDLVHSKTDLSPECYTISSWFLKQLDKICKTIIIAGNHDKISNLSRLDPISSIFSMCNFKQVYYLDKECGYESGCVVDDDIVWCLYSSFDSFRKPNIDEYKIEYPNSAFLGLFHGEIKSASTDVGYVLENGLEASYFDSLDACLMGHIHKRQEINYNGIPLLYCGSLIQQDHGENLSNHGYVVWTKKDDDFEYEFKDIRNEKYGFYTFKITSIKDIEENKEKLLNL